MTLPATRRLPALALAVMLAAFAEPTAAQEPGPSRPLLGALPGGGAGDCPPAPVARARQVLELHTQLLVASLACEAHYGEEELYRRYEDFSFTHEARLERAQEVLIDAFAAVGETDPAALDDYRTEIANAETRLMNELEQGRYCRARRARFDTLIGSDPQFFEEYVEALTARSLSRSGCRQ